MNFKFIEREGKLKEKILLSAPTSNQGGAVFL
jgi:hypothetical protein